MARAPFEPNQCLELAWSLMLVLSENERLRVMGKEAQDKLNHIIEATTDPEEKLYLLEVTNAVLSTVRVLRYRSEGMERIIGTYDKVESKQIDELNNLGSITGSPASLIPRGVSAIAGGTLGATSTLELPETTSNLFIPLFGQLPGIDPLMVLFYGSIAYILTDVSLRVYRYFMIPHIMLRNTQKKSQVWNRFVRESREAVRDLLIECIRLREKYFPGYSTYDSKKLFSSIDSIDYHLMPEFNLVLTSIVALKGPQVRNLIHLRPEVIGNDWRNGRWLIKINRGDIIAGSFAVSNHKIVSCYYFEVDDPTMQPTPDEAIYIRENFAADSFSIVSSTGKEWGMLLFKNPSLFSSRQISFSCEIMRYKTTRFCS